MTSRDFAYWLQGYFEIGEQKCLSEHQVEIIRNHLNMVFTHEIDPSMGSKEHQQELQKVHAGSSDGPEKMAEIHLGDGTVEAKTHMINLFPRFNC